VKEPLFVVFETIVETVSKFVETPCFKSSVTVPLEVGVHVIATGLPAVKPASNVVAFNVKGLAPAETSAASADVANINEVVKRISTLILLS